jgi:glutathione S-transferase
MRLCEQREALINSSTAPSPPSRPDDPSEPQFLTDEDTLRESLEAKADILDPIDNDTPVWLVGTQCSIADLSFLTWANVVDRIGIDLETEFPVALSTYARLTTVGSTKMGRQHDGKTQNSQCTLTRVN